MIYLPYSLEEAVQVNKASDKINTLAHIGRSVDYLGLSIYECVLPHFTKVWQIEDI